MILLINIYLIFFIMLLYISKNDISKLLIILSFVMGFLSFFIKPFETMDLYRHYEVLNEFRIGGWSSVLNHRYYDSLPIFSIYFYFISKFYYNGFLPMITIFIEYSCIFIIISKVSKKFEFSRNSIVLSIIFFISTFNYFGAVSGIRNMLAFSVFLYFLYIDLVENRKRVICFIVYILLCMLHTSVIILLIFRLMLFIKNKLVTKFVAIALFFNSLYLPILLKILKNFSDVEILRLFMLQIEEYMKESYMEPIAHLHRTMILSVILLIYFYLYFYKKNAKVYKELNQFNNYTLLLLGLTVGFYSNFNMYARFVELLIMIAPIYIMIILNHLKGNISHIKLKRKNKNIQNKVIKNKYNRLLNKLVYISLIGVIFVSNIYLFLFQYRYIYLI